MMGGGERSSKRGRREERQEKATMIKASVFHSRRSRGYRSGRAWTDGTRC